MIQRIKAVAQSKTGTLFSTSFLAQLINFAAIWVLLFLFEQEQLGQFFAFNAFIVILTAFTSLQSPAAVVMGRSDAEAKRNLFFALTINAAMVCLSSVALLLVPPLNAYLNTKLGLSYLPLWILAGGLVYGAVLAIESYRNYHKDYKVIGTARMVRSAAWMLLAVGLGFWLRSTAALAFAFILSYLVSFVYLKWGTDRIQVRHYLSRFIFLRYVVQNKNILSYNTVLLGIVQCSAQLPTLLLLFLYGDAVTAIYGLANRIVGVPYALVGQSITQVFFQKASSLFHSRKGLLADTLRALRNGFLILALPSVVLAIAAPWVGQMLPPGKWHDVGGYVQVIVPALFVQALATPLTAVYSVISVQRKLLKYYIAGLAARIASLYLPWMVGLSALAAIGSLSAFSVLFSSFFIGFILKHTRASDRAFGF